jgi:hypothetical protein
MESEFRVFIKERECTMIDLVVSNTGMLELLFSPGNKPANFRLALMFAAMSANMSLERNCKLARYLSQYADMPLPQDREALYEGLYVASRARVLRSHVNALYSIDSAFQAGLLTPYEVLPSGYEAQCQWRSSLVKLIYGMAEKTISFCALILDPMRAELVAIDRWHMKRLNLPIQSLRTNRYLAVERSLKVERDDSGYANCPLGLWSAWQWGIIRDGDNAYQGEVTNHRSLSCRWY